MIRLGRDAAQSILSAARERNADLLLLGWPGYMSRREHAFGSIVWLLSHNPPCDLAVVRLNSSDLPRRILVPVGGGPNARLALELAVAQADAVAERTGGRPEVVGLHLLLPPEHGVDPEARRRELLDAMDIGTVPLDLVVRPTDEVVPGILEAAAGFDQIVIGASNEGLLGQSLFGSIPQELAEQAAATVIMVKRHDPVRFRLRRWLWARGAHGIRRRG
jgi:glucosyl-3-phosphoglycerate synthase